MEDPINSQWVPILSALASPIAALVGILMGGNIANRNQAVAYRLESTQNYFNARQEACIDLLSAVRRFRRFAMYTDTPLDAFPASESARIVVTFRDRAEHDARIDEALARVLIVARNTEIVRAAWDLIRQVNEFVKLRAEHGKGNIPTAMVRRMRNAENEFGAVVARELRPPW
ncbi:hypothetical protein AB0G00_32525 [Nocardia salmonicida]|uniref:hypothetical protein n=1 Tax=Nocardia salmonicida TaxID=53431 RepID=UPI0033CB6542